MTDEQREQDRIIKPEGMGLMMQSGNLITEFRFIDWDMNHEQPGWKR